MTPDVLPIILPLVWVFLSSWKTTSEIFQSPLALPQHWSLDNYIGAWTDSHIGQYMLNSFIVVTAALVIVMVLGSAAAYSLARYPFPGSGVVYYLILAGLTFPIFLAIVPLFFGAPPLTSTFFEAELPILGHVEFVTSTLFDVGVYLVVIGLVLDVLRSLGAEVDRQAQKAREREEAGVL